MKAIVLRISLAASLILAIALLAALPTFSDTSRTRPERQSGEQAAREKPARARSQVKPLSYRSPGALHKLIVASDDAGLEQKLIRAGRKARKYKSFSIVEVTDETLASLDARTLERAELRDDLNLLMLKRGQIDTTGPAPQISEDLRQTESLQRSLHLVQLFGPPTPESLTALKSTGAKIVSYIPNNAYLIWATAAARARVGKLREAGDIIQWDGPFHPAYKLDPRMKLDSSEQLRISVALAANSESHLSAAAIKSLAREVLMPEYETPGTVHIKVLIEASKLSELAKMADVMAIEPYPEIRPYDERANQIIANVLSEETVNSVRVSRPTGPGYFALLNSLGFLSNMDFAIDVSDSGLDLGSSDASKLHPDFLYSAGTPRIAYFNDYTNDSHPSDPTALPAHDTSGHGTINASILGGFSDKIDSAFADALGFRYGLGVAPFVRIGVSKVFSDTGRFLQNGTFEQVMSQAYQGGARITNNSWGTDCSIGFCNLYGDLANTFDAIVRDADSATPGNQEMIAVFAAGNDGALSVGEPATGKNVIAVGASENFRATDANGTLLRDGCGVSGSGADNALDVISFSSGGPVQDGRFKPDLVAPGTHVMGAASQDPLYDKASINDLFVCDRYFPAGQKLYTWSSGTSHATPMVSGAAALAYQWLRNATGAAPSPALVKALLLNSTSYITGNFANDNLPGARQGWGLLNIARTFEQTQRIIYDQSPDRLFTQSGGEAFETTGVIADTSKEFRVMLIWTDPPGSPATNAPYVNQLNLEVIVGGVVYNANNFSGQYSKSGGSPDILNNTQGVRLPAGTAGSFIIRVRPTIIAGDGVPNNGIDLDQDFALVVTNGLETPVPVLAIGEDEGVSQGVSVRHANGVTDSSLIPGETAGISVTLSNQSKLKEAAIASATLTLGNTVSANSTYPIINAGDSASNAAPFQVQAPSNAKCGSVIEFQLLLATSSGQVRLPVRVRAGRTSSSSSTTLLADDVDSGQVRWKMKKGFVTATGTATSGLASYHAVDPGKEDEDEQLSEMKLKKQIKIPANAGQIRLTFLHIFNFEPGFDGGVLEISTNGGETWEDIGSRIIVGGYDGKVTEASNNPLGNRFSWTSRGRPGVFSRVVINLDDFAGQKIRLRFLAGFDAATGIREGYTGWFIDDIRITANLFECASAQSSESFETQIPPGFRRAPVMLRKQ